MTMHPCKCNVDRCCGAFGPFPDNCLNKEWAYAASAAATVGCHLVEDPKPPKPRPWRIAVLLPAVADGYRLWRDWVDRQAVKGVVGHSRMRIEGTSRGSDQSPWIAQAYSSHLALQGSDVDEIVILGRVDSGVINEAIIRLGYSTRTRTA